jgi:hypothetical protein
MKKEYKAEIIQVSFKTTDIKEKLLLDWLQSKFETYGKSNYIKLVLKEKMEEELLKNE